MARDYLYECQEVLDSVLDMKISDFLILCAESGVNISLITSVISVCLYEMACRANFNKNK